MKKYGLIGIIFITFLLMGCNGVEDKQIYSDNTVILDRGDIANRALSRMKRDNNVNVTLELLGKIIEYDGNLIIETEDCLLELADEYKKVASTDDIVWMRLYGAYVSSYDEDTITFAYDDFRMYKVVSTEQLLEQYGGTKCNTYYITSIPKGLCSIDDYTFSPITGYYVDGKDISFIDNSLFSYDYFEEDYLTGEWFSPYEDDELLNKNRLLEINQSNIGLYSYIESYQDSFINY